MDKQSDAGRSIHRRIATLKVTTRLIEHELDAAKGREITLDRDLVENMLDTIEVFIEDVDTGRPEGGRERRNAGEKPTVTRLN
jgi:hypothetical protein